MTHFNKDSVKVLLISIIFIWACERREFFMRPFAYGYNNSYIT